jgi:hypothetical protein
MYDGNKIIAGLVIFIVLLTYPIWSSLGGAAQAPKPSLETPVIEKMAEKKCIENTQFMKSSHMQLLIDWRDEALRNGNRTFKNTEGKNIVISLQNTCMKCHSNKDKFCDSCHTFAAVKPYCWECHLTPEKQDKGF